MDDLERDEFVVLLSDAAHEEEGSVASVDDFGVCAMSSPSQSSRILCRRPNTGASWPDKDRCELGLNAPLYSRKLHMRVRRARTSCVTSLTILPVVCERVSRRWSSTERVEQDALLLRVDMVVYHFASLTLP